MLPTQLPANVSEMYQRSLDESRTLRVLTNTNTLFEVERRHNKNEFRVVNLETGDCSCGFMREFGVPCHRLCAAAINNNIDPRSFIIPDLRLDTLQAAYAGMTLPIDLTVLQDDGLKPPLETKRRGRPKKKRIVSSAEKDVRRTVTCGHCGARGHNSRTCKER